jgi:hypothetical protein
MKPPCQPSVGVGHIFKAGEPLEVVSEEFGVPLPELEDAVRVALRRAA